MIGPKAERMTPAESKAGYERAAERAGGVCEGCAQKPAEQMHHRLHRSHGGNEAVANLLHLCHDCHYWAHHASERYEIGFAVRSGDDPLLVSVEHALFGRVLLTAEGTWKPVEREMDLWTL